MFDNIPERIGENILYYRGLRGMTREELAEGICDKRTLLRIEKHGQGAGIELVYRLCSRLNIPAHYIFQPLSSNHIKYVNRVKQLCREFVYKKEYVALESLIQEAGIETEKDSHYMNTDIEKYLVWHKAILILKVEGNIPKAKQHLLDIIPDNLITETDIGIANSLGMIFLDQDRENKAFKHFHNAFHTIKHIPLIADRSLFVRVGYNLALTYANKKNHDRTLDIAYELLYYLESNSSEYMKGRVHHMLGISHEYLGYYDKAGHYVLTAIQIFKEKKQDLHVIEGLCSLSEIQFKMGEREQARCALKRADNKLQQIGERQDIRDRIDEISLVYLQGEQHII
ncbi:transcriptional regulator [Virgibacillus oceani]